jgi:hypothetical protein
MIDVYSGRPNPTMDLDVEDSRSLLRTVALNRAVLASAPAHEGRLGYRGVRVSVLAPDLANEFGLPFSFYLAGGAAENEQGGIEIVESLLGGRYPRGRAQLLTDESDEARSYIQEQLRSLPLGRPEAVTSEPGADKGAHLAVCATESVAGNFTFWNDRSRILRNNCYAFACNRATDNFPQPGAFAGLDLPQSQIGCDRVQANSLADGAKLQTDCQPDSTKPRFLVALVCAPARDYHWYRFLNDGTWGHKPGCTPAKNTDDAGLTIYNPENASRGMYTDFCGYFIIPNTIKISGSGSPC